MPKTDMDYSRTIMYKIVSNDLSIKDCYVGHTTNFSKRKATHKFHCNNENSNKSNYLLYNVIRENGGWCSWSMIQLEEYPCNSVNEACSRERYWLETLSATLNKQVPTRTKKEYNETNKEELREKKKEYCEKNKEEIREKQKEYYKNNREERDEKHKEYYETHREEIKKYHKEYYETIKDALKEKTECECGAIVCSVKLLRHQQSQKHFKLLKGKSNLEI